MRLELSRFGTRRFLVPDVQNFGSGFWIFWFKNFGTTKFWVPGCSDFGFWILVVQDFGSFWSYRRIQILGWSMHDARYRMFRQDAWYRMSTGTIEGCMPLDVIVCSCQACHQLGGCMIEACMNGGRMNGCHRMFMSWDVHQLEGCVHDDCHMASDARCLSDVHQPVGCVHDDCHIQMFMT